MRREASIVSVSGPNCDETAYGCVGTGNGNSMGSETATLSDCAKEGCSSESSWTASNASSIALPKKKGFMDVVCSLARIDVLTAMSSVEERVSDFAITGMTFVRADSRCMKSMSAEMS